MSPTQCDQSGRSLSRNFSSLCSSMRIFSKPHYDAQANSVVTRGNTTIIYPRGLNITWGNDKRYWQLPRLADPKGGAELVQVSWLEVTGSTGNVEAGKRYKVGFIVSLKPEAFGWDDCDIYIMAKIGKRGKFSSRKLNILKKTGSEECFEIPEDPLEITVAMPPAPGSSKDCRLYFGMYDVWSQEWKGGLKIYHAFVQKLDDVTTP